MNKEPTLEELAVAFNWDWVTENMRQDAQLRQFVGWAKYQLPLSNHAPIDREILETVIHGVERCLNGKTPWIKKGGNKQKREEMWEAYFLCNFDRVFQEALQHKRQMDEGGIYALVGNKVNKSPIAIQTLEAKAKKIMKTSSGQNEFTFWYLSSSYNTEGLNWAKFTPHDEVSK
ncbi:hypothetical protein G6662_07355 [Polynucleobacter paneuropaeus]|nr:hypothetical protein [Polynucleobacter paneuropaeus]